MGYQIFLRTSRGAILTEAGPRRSSSGRGGCWRMRSDLLREPGGARRPLCRRAAHRRLPGVAGVAAGRAGDSARWPGIRRSASTSAAPASSAWRSSCATATWMSPWASRTPSPNGRTSSASRWRRADDHLRAQGPPDPRAPAGAARRHRGATIRDAARTPSLRRAHPRHLREPGRRPHSRIHMVDYFPLVKRIVATSNAISVVATAYTQTAAFKRGSRCSDVDQPSACAAVLRGAGAGGSRGPRCAPSSAPAGSACRRPRRWAAAVRASRCDDCTRLIAAKEWTMRFDRPASGAERRPARPRAGIRRRPVHGRRRWKCRPSPRSATSGPAPAWPGSPWRGPTPATPRTGKMLYEINAALDFAMHDDAVKVVIMAADGPHFSSGHHLGDRLADRRARRAGDGRRRLRAAGRRGLHGPGAGDLPRLLLALAQPAQADHRPGAGQGDRRRADAGVAVRPDRRQRGRRSSPIRWWRSASTGTSSSSTPTRWATARPRRCCSPATRSARRRPRRSAWSTTWCSARSWSASPSRWPRRSASGPASG